MSLTSTPKIPSVDPHTSNKKEFSNASLTSTSTAGEDNQLRKPTNATATARSDSPTVLWSIEDGVRPSTITAANNQGNSFSPTNLFGSPSSNSTGGGGGFLNLPLPSTLMALKQKQAAAIATHNTVANRNGQQNNFLKMSLDQSQPLLPLRAFLASRNQNSSISKTLAATSVNSFQSRFDSANKTISYFSRQNIENICVNLRIETIEEFCCFPAAKISEASAVQLVFSNNNTNIRKSPQATSANTSNEKNDSTAATGAQKIQTPMVDPVVSFLAVSDAHRELKRVGARIDWARRLRPIYDKYCPARIPQLPMLLQAYNGEEEALWRSVREKYEHDYAVAAALLEVQSDHEVNNNHTADGNENNNNNNASMEQVQNQLQQQQQTITMLQQMYAQSQDDLRSLAHEYNEAIAGLTDRAEKAEGEVGKLRLVNVEQLEWIKVLEQRLSSVNSNTNNNNNNHASSSSVNLSSPLAAKILNSPQMIYQQQQQQQLSPIFNNNNSNAAAASVRSSSPSNNNNNNATSVAAMNVQKVNGEIRHYLRNKLTDFYAKYDPSRVPEVDAVLEQWKGKEVELDRLLETPPAGRY